MRLAITVLLTVLTSMTACSPPQPEIRKGSEVSLLYKAKTEDGIVVDENPESGPIVFKVGAGKLQPRVEEALYGMRRGEHRVITVENAYGTHDPKRTGSLVRSAVPEDAEIGDRLSMANGLTAKILRFKGNAVILDINHPLASKTITFEVDVVDVQNPE